MLEKSAEIILREVRKILKTPEIYPVTNRAKEIMGGIRNTHRLFDKAKNLKLERGDARTAEWKKGYVKAVIDILGYFPSDLIK